MPFLHISEICFVPREAGPNHIPSINDTVVGGSEGIGAEFPSGRGTVIWDGRRWPSVCWINAFGSGRSSIVPKI